MFSRIASSLSFLKMSLSIFGVVLMSSSTGSSQQSQSIGSDCFANYKRLIYPKQRDITIIATGKAVRNMGIPVKLKDLAAMNKNIPALCIQELMAIKGDVNRDGIINEADYSKISRLASGLDTLDGFSASDNETLFRAEVIEDGAVSASDKAAAQNMAIGLYSREELLGFLTKRLYSCASSQNVWFSRNGVDEIFDGSRFDLEYVDGKKMRLIYNVSGVKRIVNSGVGGGTLQGEVKYCLHSTNMTSFEKSEADYSLFMLQFKSNPYQLPPANNKNFLLNADGSPQLLNFEEAKAACAARKLHLPSAREVVASSWIYGVKLIEPSSSLVISQTTAIVRDLYPVYTQFSPNIVVDFYSDSRSYYGMYYVGLPTTTTFWTSTSHPSNLDKYAYAFDGKTGYLRGQTDKVTSKLTVKCF